MGLFSFLGDGSAGILAGGHVTVRTAAALTGYSPQYLRRLLRRKKLAGSKIGQQWLVDLPALQNYLAQAAASPDRRGGPRPAQTEEVGG